MSDNKHTPGPWFTKREGFSTVYVEARLRQGVIQEVAACGPTEAGQEQQEANARLISAAPELLAALEAALAELDIYAWVHHPKGADGARDFNVVRSHAKSAIAKARGEV